MVLIKLIAVVVQKLLYNQTTEKINQKLSDP